MNEQEQKLANRLLKGMSEETRALESISDHLVLYNRLIEIVAKRKDADIK